MAWFRRRKPGRPRKAPPPPCPDCGKPTNLAGRFCRACGWDADLEESGDAYLGGVELPTGWGREEEAAAEDGRSPGMRAFLLVAGVLALISFIGAFIL